MPEARPQLVLAFDFGLRRIGIASGDTVSGCAAPHRAVTIGPSGLDWSQIDRTLAHFKPDLLVVGSPYNADGSRTALSAEADRFAAALAARAQLPVRRADEYASSLEAAAELKRHRQSGQRRRRVQRTDIDSAAAAIILERWLDRKRSAGDETGGDD